jgi:hypothetical protein
MRLYGILDIAFAALYAFIAFIAAPSREWAFPTGVTIVCVLMTAAGIGLLLGKNWGRVLALIASWTLLAGCALVIAALVFSSAYLRGVYGGFGRGAALVCLLFAALVFELAGLFPILQIRFLRRARS